MKNLTIKQKLIWYFAAAVILMFIGAFAIGHFNNYLQGAYDDSITHSNGYTIEQIEGELHYQFDSHTSRESFIYNLIGSIQLVLIPLWCMGCLAVTGSIFYRRELKRPLDILENSARRIADNDLDFTVEIPSEDELGQLCSAFEKMRGSLLTSQRELWRTLEDRRRLNSAFAHDLRTPLTVLRGYCDFISKYYPTGKIGEEKLLSTVEMMSGSVERLQSYADTMAAVGRLEDITPEPKEISSEEFTEKIRTAGKEISEKFTLSAALPDSLYIDENIVMRVFENITANAERYRREKISCDMTVEDGVLNITVCDDGGGFSAEALKKAADPFYRSDKEDNSHFGMGLYICKILCESCHGELIISNCDGGAEVIAKFPANNFEK